MDNNSINVIGKIQQMSFGFDLIVSGAQFGNGVLLLFHVRVLCCLKRVDDGRGEERHTAGGYSLLVQGGVTLALLKF